MDFVVPPPGGQRLDRTLADGLGVTVARAKAAIEAGSVRVDGHRARKGDRVPGGAKVHVELPDELGAPLPQPELPLTVLHEDSWLLAVAKPAGWLCHPLVAGETGTLANALVARYPETAAAGPSPREAGLCQRLDRETSGVLLVARSPAAWRAIRGKLQGGEIEKVYLALVRGEPPDEGRCELPLSQRGTAPPRVKDEPDARAKSVRPARTTFLTLKRNEGLALLEVRIETGVRYQIRAHLAALGFPLAGDAVYGGGDLPAPLGRHLLHAWRLRFEHPESGQRLSLEAPLPEDAVAYLQTQGLR